MLLSSAPEGLAVEGGKAAVFVAVGDGGGAGAVDHGRPAAVGVIGIFRRAAQCVRRLEKLLCQRVVAVRRRIAVDVRHALHVVAVRCREGAALEVLLLVFLRRGQLGAGDVARLVIGRGALDPGDRSGGDVVGGVVGVGIFCAVCGRVRGQVRAGIPGLFRARAGLRGGGDVAVGVIGVGLHRLLPQGEVVEPGRAGIVVERAVDDDPPDRLAALLRHDGPDGALPVGGGPAERDALLLGLFHALIEDLCDQAEVARAAAKLQSGVRGGVVRLRPAGEQERRVRGAVQRDGLADM